MQSTDVKKRKLLKIILGLFVCSGSLLCTSCMKKTAKINYQKCVSCGLCESICPHDAISSLNGKMKINQSKCTGCSKCVNACNYGAITI